MTLAIAKWLQVFNLPGLQRKLKTRDHATLLGRLFRVWVLHSVSVAFNDRLRRIFGKRRVGLGQFAKEKPRSLGRDDLVH
jgi:hypothetical protein